MRSSNYIRLLLNMALFLTPLIISPRSYDYFYYPKISFVYSIILLMIAIQIVSANRKQLKNDFMDMALLLFAALTALAIVFSEYPLMAVIGKPQRIEGLLTIVAYILLFKFSKAYYKESDKYISLVVLSAVIVSIYGISQYFGFDPIPRDEIRISWSGRAFSTMGNPNFLGTYMVLILSIPMFSFLRDSKKINLLTSSIIYLCLLLTFTRSALLGFVVILSFVTIFVIKHRDLWKNFIVLMIVFASITIFVNAESDGKLYGRFLSIGNDAQALFEEEDGYEKAGANRIYIWLRTIDLIKASPLVGYGLENLQTVFVEKYQDEMMEIFGEVYLVDRAHNEYLHIAVSSGIPVLIAYLVFIYLCLKKGFELLRKDISYLPYLTAVSAYLVQAFFNISVVSVAYIFWIFLGIITNDNVFKDERSI